MHRAVWLVAALAACQTGIANAQPSASFPAKHLRIIVPVAAGGNVDLVARALAQRLSESLGQQVLVENRPGASSLVGTQFVARAPADGYTLLAMANTFATAPHIMPNAGYDPVKDFTGVSLTCLIPMVLVTNMNLPVRTVKELIALARARPGEIAYASAGGGSTGHMAAELLSMASGIKLLHVPYKGNAPALIDLIGGQVMMMFDQVSTSSAYIKAGKIRALAVTTRTRTPLFPDLPTIDEAAVKGFDDVTFNGLIAPAGTPRDVLARLHAEVRKAVATPELRDRFQKLGVDLVASASPDEFSEYLKSVSARNAKLAQAAGLTIK